MLFRYRLQPESILVVFFVSLVSKIQSENSLFDELPLNGALVPEEKSSYKTSSSNLRSLKVAPSRTPTTTESRTSRKNQETPSQPSLFDELPNQGALAPGSKSRNPRDSDFDITRIAPSNEFDLPYWDTRLLAPIVNSISKPQNNPSTRLPLLPNHRGPQGFRNSYGPPPPPPPPPHSRAHSYFYRNSYHHHHRPPPPRPQQREDNHSQNKSSYHHVSANSGGPTVIVYAHPKKDLASSSSSDQSTGYPSASSDSSQSKNEIHYHYHINGEESTAKPDSGYAPSSYYGRPASPQLERHRPTPPTQAYGPPPTRKGLNSNSRQNGYSQDSRSYSNHPSDDAQNEEDDFSSRTFFTPSRTPPSSYRPTDSNSLTPPSSSYEVPPSFNAPSSTYNAPSNNYGPPNNSPAQPESSYGPPTTFTTASPPAPPPPSSDQEGGDQYETTITLQTIPITRQVTELVQVPNVVHKISSNRPSVSDQPTQDEAVGTPSPVYGPPGPPLRQKNKKPQFTSNSNNGRTRLRGNERPFDSHLEQILGVGPTQNPKDTVLQELLLGQARNPGYDMTLNDLELVSLLQGSRGSSGLGGHGGQYPILNPGRSLLGGLFGGNSRGLDNLNPLSLQSNRGTNSDALGTLREAFREQRLQLALSDLRRQLRDQNRDNSRERSGYRSLFTKGALLLSALTLLPSFVNPMAAAAGVGSAAASTFPNFMLPVTAAGRRRRSVVSYESSIYGINPFEKCLDDVTKVFHKRNHTLIPYDKWIGCSNHLLEIMPELSGKKHEKASRAKSKQKDVPKDKAVNNFPTAEIILPDLRKYLLPEDLVTASQCIQRDFCKNVLEFEKLPNKMSILSSYKMLTGNTMENNPWIRDSVHAAKNKKCDTFLCSQDGSI